MFCSELAAWAFASAAALGSLGAVGMRGTEGPAESVMAEAVLATAHAAVEELAERGLRRR